MPLSTEIKPASFLRDAVMAGVMLALALALQNLRLPNLVTGALVNAIFTVTLSVAGLRSALLLAGLTPVGAFLTGHLPPPLILLMPVIIPGNIVYVIITGMLRRRTLAGEAVCAAAAKALFIGVGGGSWPAGRPCRTKRRPFSGESSGSSSSRPSPERFSGKSSSRA